MLKHFLFAFDFHVPYMITIIYWLFVSLKQDLLQILLPQPLQLITSPLHFLGVSYVVATRKMASLELRSDSCACLNFLLPTLSKTVFFVDTVSLQVVSALFVRCFFLWTVMSVNLHIYGAQGNILWWSYANYKSKSVWFSVAPVHHCTPLYMYDYEEKRKDTIVPW